jgi:putative polymerase
LPTLAHAVDASLSASMTTTAAAWQTGVGVRAEPFILPALLVISALGFNAALAIINAHVTGLTSGSVIICEFAIVVGAQLLALSHYRQEMDAWYVLAGLLTVFALLRSVATQALEPKLLRDVLLIPTFTVLGMVSDRRRLNQLVLAIHAIVIAFLLLEMSSPAFYSDLLKIQSYYVQTRGFQTGDFWNTNSVLFISATRPEQRFFPFFDLHRMSSIFLEPVSLGNYCVTIAAFLCARWHTLGTASKWFLIAGNVVAIVGCDGRFAAVACGAIAVLALVAARLPRRSTVLYLPVITGMVLAAVLLGGLQVGADDFSGRIAFTADLLSRFDVQDFLGISDRYMKLAVDSGLAYFIVTQSIIGLCAVWLFVVYASAEARMEQVRYNHALCLYVSLLLMVSYALFTIKTAALLWFIHGCLQKKRIEPLFTPRMKIA